MIWKNFWTQDEKMPWGKSSQVLWGQHAAAKGFWLSDTVNMLGKNEGREGI